MDHNKIVTFYFKKGSKGVKNSEILHIGKVYRIVLSKFGAVSFLELIVLRAYGNMTTYFFNLLWCPSQIAQKMANKCRIPKFELSFLLSNFNAFWVTFESIQKMSFFDFIDVQFHCIKQLSTLLSLFLVGIYDIRTKEGNQTTTGGNTKSEWEIRQWWSN